jgi:hypothetical protein
MNIRKSSSLQFRKDQLAVEANLEGARLLQLASDQVENEEAAVEHERVGCDPFHDRLRKKRLSEKANGDAGHEEQREDLAEKGAGERDGIIFEVVLEFGEAAFERVLVVLEHVAVASPDARGEEQAMATASFLSRSSRRRRRGRNRTVLIGAC